MFMRNSNSQYTLVYLLNLSSRGWRSVHYYYKSIYPTSTDQRHSIDHHISHTVYIHLSLCPCLSLSVSKPRPLFSYLHTDLTFIWTQASEKNIFTQNLPLFTNFKLRQHIFCISIFFVWNIHKIYYSFYLWMCCTDLF